MNTQEILISLQTLMRKFFKIPDLIISEITTTKDIDAWNSLNHMSLISEIEKQFKIQFDFFEVMDFENIDELLKSIENKI